MKDFVDKFMEEFHYIRKEKLSSGKHAKHHQYHENMNLIDNEVLTIKQNIKFIKLKKMQDIPENLLGLMNLRKLKKKCNQLHKRIRHKLQNIEQHEEDLNAELNENMMQR